jgi:uncharacterized membrane protein required for colicin V production
MNGWNGLDFLIFVILLFNTLLGMSRGAAREIISLLCLSATLICTIKFTVPLATFFNSSPLINDVITSRLIQNFMASIGAGPLTQDMVMQIAYSVSLLICFVGSFSILEAVLAFTNTREVFKFPYAVIDRKVAAALGCIRGYIFSLVLLSILTLHLLANNQSNPLIANSFFTNLFSSQTAEFDSFVASQLPEQYQQLYKQNPYNSKAVLQNVTQNFF